MRNHELKYEAFECGEGPTCSIAPAVLAAAITTGGGILSGLMGNKKAENSAQYAADYNQANANLGMPKWSEDQYPYVWGQGYNFAQPEISPEAMAYGDLLSSGRTPGGQVNPMSLAQLSQPHMPWNENMMRMAGYGAPQAPSGNSMWTPESMQAQQQAPPPPQAPSLPDSQSAQSAIPNGVDPIQWARIVSRQQDEDYYRRYGITSGG